MFSVRQASSWRFRLLGWDLIAHQAAAATVSLYPSSNIQTVINAKPAGTTYELTAGVYRMQTITPKDGDTFIGQGAAVLNGSRLATRFSQEQ